MASSKADAAPALKSILIPPSAPAAPASAAQASKKSRFKDAFGIQSIRAQVQRNAPPLGHSYRRAVPLSSEDRAALKGPSVLSSDPRGSGATFGDGVLPFAADAHNDDSPVGSTHSVATCVEQKPRAEDSNSTFDSDTTRAPPSLRFAPLPVGRQRRRQSFSVGLAARSHLLSYQGSAPKAPREQAPAPQAWGLDPALMQAAQKQAAACHRTGGPAARRDDVVDVGEVVQDGVKRIFRRLRKDKAVPGQVGGESEKPANVRAEQEAAFRERSHSISIAELKLHPDHIPTGTPSENVPEFVVDEEDEEQDSTGPDVPEELKSTDSAPPQQPVWQSPYQHPQIPRGEHDYCPPEWEDEENIPHIAPV